MNFTTVFDAEHSLSLLLDSEIMTQKLFCGFLWIRDRMKYMRFSFLFNWVLNTINFIWCFQNHLIYLLIFGIREIIPDFLKSVSLIYYSSGHAHLSWHLISLWIKDFHDRGMKFTVSTVQIYMVKAESIVKLIFPWHVLASNINLKSDVNIKESNVAPWENVFNTMINGSTK